MMQCVLILISIRSHLLSYLSIPNHRLYSSSSFHFFFLLQHASCFGFRYLTSTLRLASYSVTINVPLGPKVSHAVHFPSLARLLLRGLVGHDLLALGPGQSRDLPRRQSCPSFHSLRRRCRPPWSGPDPAGDPRILDAQSYRRAR